MQSNRPDQLTYELWLKEMSRLADFCSNESETKQDRAIRQAYYLSELCPKPLQTLLNSGYSELELEILLERGESVKAARLIAGDDVSVSPLHPAKATRHSAFLSLEEGHTAEFEANSAALAIIGAWARSLTETPQPADQKKRQRNHASR